MNIMFMGTPGFGIPTLQKLLASKHKITFIVTMPDKPRGRDLKIIYSPVKQFALDHGIPLYQPSNLKDPEVIEAIKGAEYDAALICAYGKIIPDWLLEHPRHGCVNIHPSLLPLYRGPSPIESAVLSGDKKTGVTIMEVTSELDSGAILIQEEVGILDADTSGTLSKKLAELSAGLTVKAFDQLEDGILKAKEQEHTKATYTTKFTSADALIDWKMTSREIFNRVRAFNPKPGAYTYIKDKRMKILEVRPSDLDAAVNASVNTSVNAAHDPNPVAAAYDASITVSPAEPGTILQADAGSLIATTGDSRLELLTVQLEGKRVMSAQELLRGFKIERGGHFG